MGPWLRSHGRGGVLHGLTHADERFNGAVASQPRKAAIADGAVTLAKTTGFNGAVASQPRKVPSSWGKRAVTAGFNGAVASQPRKDKRPW